MIQVAQVVHQDRWRVHYLYIESQVAGQVAQVSQVMESIRITTEVGMPPFRGAGRVRGINPLT